MLSILRPVFLLAFAMPLSAQFQLCETTGTASADALGSAIAGVRNGNGAGLVWIGAPQGTSPGQQSNTGTVLVRDASCASPPPFFFPLASASTGDRFGAAIAAGSQNELLIGIPDFSGPAGAGSGAVRVVSATTGATIRVLSGAAAGQRSGAGVAFADVDGDGVADHVVGSPGIVRNQQCGCCGRDRSVGGVEVFSGLTGLRLGILTGTFHCSAHAAIGAVVAGLGDADGVTGDEIVVGAPVFSQVYVASLTMGGLTRQATISGSTSFGSAVAALGDLDGDGAPDFAVGAPAVREVTLYSGATGTQLALRWVGVDTGFGAVLANIGDQDGDGRHDLLVGAPDADGGRGVVRVFSTASGHLLGTVWGDEPAERMGAAASSVPDWTGDGVAEIALGAPGAASGAGRCVVVTLDAGAAPAGAYWTSLGAACAPSGTNGIPPRIGTPNGPPRAGATRFSVGVAETAPGVQALLFIGSSQLPTPFHLGFVGMPSCALELQPWSGGGVPFPTMSATSALGPGGGAATATIPIPATVSPGVAFYVQWYVLDVGVAFPATMTAALRLVTS